MTQTDTVNYLASHYGHRSSPQAPAKQFSSLTEKITAANRFAAMNNVIQSIKLGIDAEGKVVLANKITFPDVLDGAKEVAALNRVLEEVTAKVVKDNEAEIRRILGRRR